MLLSTRVINGTPVDAYSYCTYVYMLSPLRMSEPLQQLFILYIHYPLSAFLPINLQTLLNAQLDRTFIYVLENQMLF